MKHIDSSFWQKYRDMVPAIGQLFEHIKFGTVYGEPNIIKDPFFNKLDLIIEDKELELGLLKKFKRELGNQNE